MCKHVFNGPDKVEAVGIEDNYGVRWECLACLKRGLTQSNRRHIYLTRSLYTGDMSPAGKLEVRRLVNQALSALKPLK